MAELHADALPLPLVLPDPLPLPLALPDALPLPLTLPTPVALPLPRALPVLLWLAHTVALPHAMALALAHALPLPLPLLLPAPAPALPLPLLLLQCVAVALPVRLVSAEVGRGEGLLQGEGDWVAPPPGERVGVTVRVAVCVELVERVLVVLGVPALLPLAQALGWGEALDRIEGEAAAVVMRLGLSVGSVLVTGVPVAPRAVPLAQAVEGGVGAGRAVTEAEAWALTLAPWLCAGVEDLLS